MIDFLHDAFSSQNGSRHPFNRRYDLGEMIPRLAFVAIRTLPMPYHLLKLA
ncbi:MAG: hypothetical protein ACR652_02925 [Methylocystis sp.]|uniref:hypothetical protein n=1 Tax=Methylocystis sp. TaxID=1911079 RepID=UPI003DA358FB